MAAGVLDLVIDQGDDWEYPIAWTVGGVAVPLAGYTARAQFRERAGSEAVLADLTTENGRIVLGPADGAVLLRVPPSLSRSWTWERAAWDLFMVPASGGPRKLLRGGVRHRLSVTVLP